MPAAPPIFGKRHAVAAPVPQGGAPQSHASDPVQASDYAAFLAATREALAAPENREPTGVVPRSVLAAALAAVIVGCCLVGLDVSRAKEAAASGETVDLMALLGGTAPIGGSGGGGVSPSLILAGVLGGARAAAACLLIGHAALAALGLTGPIAYVAGGAASSLAFAGLLSFAVGLPPSHGWLICGLAGAGAGFLYRMFAGCRTS